MRTGFGPLIRRFGTGSPNVKAITNVLVSDYYVPEASAVKAAELLVEMATECKLVVEGRFKPAEIERADEAGGDQAAALPEAPAAPKPRSAKPAAPRPAPAAAAARTTASPVAGSKPAAQPAGSTPAPSGGGATPVPFGLGPTVVLNVDATKLTAVEIGEIVRELRKVAGSS